MTIKLQNIIEFHKSIKRVVSTRAKQNADIQQLLYTATYEAHRQNTIEGEGEAVFFTELALVMENLAGENVTKISQWITRFAPVSYIKANRKTNKAAHFIIVPEKCIQLANDDSDTNTFWEYAIEVGMTLDTNQWFKLGKAPKDDMINTFTLADADKMLQTLMNKLTGAQYEFVAVELKKAYDLAKLEIEAEVAAAQEEDRV